MGQIKLRKAFKDMLRNMYYGSGKNVSKHTVSTSDNVKRIHSRETLNTYQKQADMFAGWCYEHGCRYDVQQSRELAKKYLQWLIDSGKSAWTVRTAGAALAKIFECKSTDFGVEYPKRERLSVKRSRYAAERDRHVSQEANKLLITTARCTGLRRHELEEVRGRDLFRDENGTYWVHVGKAAKGGRPRNTMIFGGENEINDIVRAFQNSGNGKVFDHVHSKLDVHALRSVYACTVYKEYARPVELIPKEDRYCCRKDKAGIVYDRKAMEITSKLIGHNRISVIADSYLHNL